MEYRKEKISGVIYTRDIVFDRPYYMVNYSDDGVSRSNTGDIGKYNLWIARNVSREFLDECFYKLIDKTRQIEAEYDENDVLAIEFDIDNDDCIKINQVTVIDSCIGGKKTITDHEFLDTKAFAKCNYLDNNHILSDQAYFNLTDVIGNNPRPLDYTLLRVLITSKIWNESLVKLGYSNVDDEVMVRVGNKPYISVNNTYRCFIPGKIDNQLKDKLLNYFDELIRSGDRAAAIVKKENVLGVYNCSTDKKLNILKESGFKEQECETIKLALKDVTANIINSYDKISKEDDLAMEEMAKLRREIRSYSPLTETNSMKLYGYITRLFEMIKKNGSPQYTRHSRGYSIAKSILRSLADEGYFEYEKISEYIQSIPNVMSDFAVDFDSYCMGRLSLEEFKKKYGHLRVEMFNIRTECYKKEYTEDFTDNPLLKKQGNFIAESMNSRINRIDAGIVQEAFRRANFDVDAETFLSFTEAVIKNKEKYLFELTKSIGLVLDIIIQLGETLGIAREDMSYLEISELLSYHSRDTYIQMISERRNMYYANTYLILPEVIYGVGDIDVICANRSKPCFITKKVVEAETVNLDEDKGADVTGKIVILSKPGAGYDWLFTKNIAGLITKQGNENSYIVKRCKEFDVPAAIGCGEKLYTEVCRMVRVKIDCLKERIKEI